MSVVCWPTPLLIQAYIRRNRLRSTSSMISARASPGLHATRGAAHLLRVLGGSSLTSETGATDSRQVPPELLVRLIASASPFVRIHKLKEAFDYPAKFFSGCRARFNWQGVQKFPTGFDEELESGIVDASVLPPVYVLPLLRKSNDSPHVPPQSQARRSG